MTWPDWMVSQYNYCTSPRRWLSCNNGQPRPKCSLWYRQHLSATKKRVSLDFFSFIKDLVFLVLNSYTWDGWKMWCEVILWRKKAKVKITEHYFLPNCLQICLFLLFALGCIKNRCNILDLLDVVCSVFRWINFFPSGWQSFLLQRMGPMCSSESIRFDKNNFKFVLLNPNFFVETLVK